jgi:integrase
MTLIREELHDAEVVRSASMAQVAAKDDNRPPKYEVRKRPNGVYAIFRNNCYLVTTKTRDEALAEEILDLHKLQDEAKSRKIVDARFVLATVVLDYRRRTYSKKRVKSRRVLESTIKALRPYLEGLRVQDLDGDWLAETEEAMLKEYDYSYFYACISKLISAIERYCSDKLCPVIRPFERPEPPDGRDRVLTRQERDRILRWAGGDEGYDPATETFTPPLRPLDEYEANLRLMVYRATCLGLPLGSRPGVYKGMAWESNPRFGHIDLENATMHRHPSGASKRKRKNAPSVALPPGLLAEVWLWKQRDGNQAHVFRNASGGPLSQARLNVYFTDAMRRLGIEGVSGHTLRHTAITWMIELGLSATVISAVCGISTDMLKRRYDHSDDRVVQAIGHSVMDAMLL